MAIHVVGTDLELAAAIRKAAGGDIIQLKPVVYQNLTVWTAYDPKWTTPVTITTAPSISLRPGIAPSPNADVAKIRQVKLSGATNLIIERVEFAQEMPPGLDPNQTRFEVKNSENITVRNCVFNGHNAAGQNNVNDGYGVGIALTFRGCKNIEVSHNRFTTFYRALTCGSVDGVTVTGNIVRDMASDGMNFSAVQNVKILNNDFQAPRRSPLSKAHPDAIQFWTAGTVVPCENIEIAGNVIFVSPDYLGTQSIFIRNEAIDRGAGPEMLYRNISIHHNTIVNGSSHGITVGPTDGLVISDNFLMNHKPAKKLVECPRINVDPRAFNVTIKDNVQPIKDMVTPLPLPSNWTVSGNQAFQREDAAKPNYYGTAFKDPFNPVYAADNFSRKAS